MASQTELIKEYFVNRPNTEILQEEVTEWCQKTWKQRTGKYFHDVQRGTRKLAQEGWLQRTDKKGVFIYDPNKVVTGLTKMFSAADKQTILARDNYTCQFCGATEAEGETLVVDHIKPIDKGGHSIIDNGQVLCTTCNNRKKHYGHKEFGRRMFQNMLKTAEKINDGKTKNFASEILAVFDKHGVNAGMVKNQTKNPTNSLFTRIVNKISGIAGYPKSRNLTKIMKKPENYYEGPSVRHSMPQDQK